jgi:hypothetical protein
VAVTDGDTVKVLTAEKQLLRVHVAWIDAPESSQAFGQRAKQAMSALLFDKNVELRFQTVDRYGRLVCMVFVDGKDAGLKLIRQGVAWKFDRYLPEASPDIQQSYTARPKLQLGLRELGFGLTLIHSRLGSIGRERKSNEHRIFSAMNPEHKGDSTSFSNPGATRADFTYSMTPIQIKIVDLNTGKASVTNDIESVLRKIEAWHQGSIAGYQIMYRDSDGYWDGVEWNGEQPRFFAIRERDETAAEKKLLAHTKRKNR